MSSATALTARSAGGLPSGPLFFYRPSWNEHRFLGDYPTRAPFDAAIVLARYLAPHPPGTAAAKRGSSGREIAEAMIGVRAPFVIDPDTPVLAALGAGVVAPTPRVLTMAHAQAVTLPVSALSLATPAVRTNFVQAAAAAQRGASALAAPYFQFEGMNDPWHKRNLEMLDETTRISQGRPLVAFVQVPLESLVAGELSRSAGSYRGLGLDRAFVRVAGFSPVEATGTEVRAYQRALDAFQDEGIPAIADCVGRFGLVTTAGGCAGFSSGAIRHQWIARDAIYHADEMISDPCRYEVPRRWFALDYWQAVQAEAQGLLPACPVSNCNALASGSGSSELKEHLIHYFVHAVRAFAATGAHGGRQSLTTHPAGTWTNAWLSAL